MQLQESPPRISTLASVLLIQESFLALDYPAANSVSYMARPAALPTLRDMVTGTRARSSMHAASPGQPCRAAEAWVARNALNRLAGVGYLLRIASAVSDPTPEVQCMHVTVIRKRKHGTRFSRKPDVHNAAKLGHWC